MASSVEPKFGWSSAIIRSYTANSAITAARLVESITGTDLVQPASAGSTKVVGVACWDVPATRASIQGPQVGDGHELKVAKKCVIPVTNSGGSAVGDLLIADTGGKVKTIPVVDPTNAASVDADVTNTRGIIGRAVEAAADGETKLVEVF
jgi:hypothetical protein